MVNSKESLEGLSFNAELDLSKAEIAIIGGTLSDFNPDIFLEQLRLKNQEIFIPIGILNGMEPRLINSRREQQEVLSGAMVFVDPVKLSELNKRLLKPAVYLDPFDENSSDQQFRLGVLSYRDEPQGSDFSCDFFVDSLKEAYKEYFNIEIRNDNVYMVRK